MASGSRRVWLYWLLLLLPTLVVGGGMAWLLTRERARLDEQTSRAAESRRAGVEARARLIAENVELLVGDVQNGLMVTLREVPAIGRSGFLDDWEKKNPLVKMTFVIEADGRITRPVSAADRAWLLRWRRVEVPAYGAIAGRADRNMAAEKSEVATSNSAQVQVARNRLQETARIKGGPALEPEQSAWSSFRDGTTLHMLGWRKLAEGRVIGVEVALSVMASRLGDVLPQTSEPGEAYELREAGGATFQQKNYTSVNSPVKASARGETSSPMITVPVAENILPGWEVAGFLMDAAPGFSSGTFFALSVAFSLALFGAILIGGVLLLQQARRSEADAAQKTSFVANVSHEFKTPLTTIRLYAELLAQGRVRDEPRRADYLQTIGQETERLARLVNNVLDFSRLEQGKKKFALESLDLGSELDRILDMLAPVVEKAGLSLLREFPEDVVRVFTDRDALGQIVLNLVDNACKYAAGGREVSVGLERRGMSGARIVVADRGPGVPADLRTRIFEKFQRGDDSLTSAQRGTGLGLSIARQMARGLGGELHHADRAGGGAKFILDLP